MRSPQVRTDKWWFHVVSSEPYTYLLAGPTRGKDAPDEAGVLGAFGGVMVHDRLAMYFKYDQATHVIWGSHLLRDLAAVGVGRDQGWANDMATLLTEMNSAAHDARAKGKRTMGGQSPHLVNQCSTSSQGAGQRLDLPVMDRGRGIDVLLFQRLFDGTPEVPGLPITSFLEVPLDAWSDVGGSKVRLRGSLTALWDVVVMGVHRTRRRQNNRPDTIWGRVPE